MLTPGSRDQKSTISSDPLLPTASPLDNICPRCTPLECCYSHPIFQKFYQHRLVSQHTKINNNIRPSAPGLLLFLELLRHVYVLRMPPFTSGLTTFLRCSPQVRATEISRYLPVACSLLQARLGVSTTGMYLSNTTTPI